ncbi:MAG: polyprenyl synthetase family protein, partial [Propioniciclava sp.]
MVTLSAEHPVSDDFRAALGASIAAFLGEQEAVLRALDPAAAPLLARARDFTAGGKRLRPAFAAWAWV